MVIKEGTEVIVSTVDAMKSVPLALALLVVNCAFLAFAAYVLGQVSSNAAERNKNQMELISSLATNCYPVSREKQQ
ncbi:hypothetical protein KIP88_02650 [Bradyrhizobium sp. SRL28]|uniref:hypothetical protein n=1 Tax=Bradyrhizobium sp. SRL28 TaxID=2836178 RepID=UPI001BDDF7AC|nr:hypothetical protein [Bradyrhizobium sp. SRL28]MBT1509390.1 hypothetical protein [Bradyrhizobium sp. SRL28]